MSKTALALVIALLPMRVAEPRVPRNASGTRENVQNRSANRNVNQNVNRNVNRDVNVNRNRDVNINTDRDVDVNVNRGYGYNRGGVVVVDDNHWGWGEFAAGAAVGVAAGAIAGAAAASPAVVAVPAMGTVVGGLPGGCATVATAGAVIYNCNSVYYRPYYQGASLVYQVVRYP
jgi:hypothetical protein